MSLPKPTATYLELRESDERGEARSGLSHSAEGLVLLHVLELAADGEPRGAATVVHDAGAHGARYVDLARALAARGWAVALPDLRGHGRSEGARGHSAGVREVVRDLGDVQDHLAYRQPEAPKVLVGHGLGALWALAYAAERAGELAGLVLAAPLVAPRFAPPQKKGGLLGRFKKPAPQDAGRLGWSPAGLGEDELVHDTITLRAGEQAEAAARSFEARLAALETPALVLAGADDPLAPPERLRALASPRCEVRILDGRGHGLLEGPRAEDARALVAAWVAERA